MKTINFDYTGGFPLDQTVLKRMQTAYLESMKTFVKHIGCGDTGKYIIHGCNVVSDTITPGMMYIDGDLCPFAGAIGSLTTKIKKLTTTTNAAFENGSNPPIYIETTAVVDASGTLLSEYIRFNFVQDPNYVHTDFNFTAALLAKLNGIEALAEKNVQSSWNELSPLSDAYIIGKPTIVEVLRHGTFDGIADIDGTQQRTVNFPDVGTTNYYVVGILKSRTASDWQGDTTVVWTIKENVTSSSFQLNLREISSTSQSLIFDYLIIRKPV